MSEYTYEVKWAHELGLTQTNTSNTLDCVDSISRQAAIDEMSKMYRAAEKWGQEAEDDTIKARAESCMASLVEIKLRVEKLPSAEPQRKRGHWVFDERAGGFFCSECGRETHDHHDVPIEGSMFGKGFALVLPYYCGFCGAKMETE